MEGNPRTLAERVAVIEERTERIPEIADDVKVLLAYMNQSKGVGLLLVKLVAVAGLVLGVWNALPK